MGQQSKSNQSVTNQDHVSLDDSPATPPPARARKKRLLLTLGVVLTAIIGLIILASSALRQHTYNGKPESYWLDSLTKPPPMSLTVTAAFVALPIVQNEKEWQALGPPAVPILLNALEMQAGPATKPYAKLWPKLPPQLHKLLPAPVDYQEIHRSAWGMLAAQTNKVSIPAKLVARDLKNQDWWIRMTALAYLSRAVLSDSGVEKNQFLPLLIRAAESPEMEIRMTAIACLGHYRDQPKLVISVLSNALANPEPEVRIRAAMALNQVDPVAAEKARVKEVAYDCRKLLLSAGAYVLAGQLLKELEKPQTNERIGRTNAAPPLP
jgi:hypothetical protein